MKLTIHQENVLRLLEALKSQGTLNGLDQATIVTYLGMNEEPASIGVAIGELFGMGLIEDASSGGYYRITQRGVDFLNPFSYEKRIEEITNKSAKKQTYSIILSASTLAVSTIAIIIMIIMKP